MHSDVTRSGAGGQGPSYPDDPLHVEESATPDGRSLLYFTFGRAGGDVQSTGERRPSQAEGDDGERPEQEG